MRNQLRIVVFGGLKAYFESEMLIEADEETTVSELLHILESSHPKSSNLISVCAIALDGTICSRDQKIGKTIEMAILPPFSGG